MITLNKQADRPNRSWLELYGLSADEKPVDKFDGVYIGNASVFVEMDTGITHIYDEENQIWYPLPSGGSGGGGGEAPADAVTMTQLTNILRSYVTTSNLTNRLSSYSTSEQISQTLENYSTNSAVQEACQNIELNVQNNYVSNTSFNSTMSNYSTTQQISDSFVSASSFDEAMSDVQKSVEEKHMTSKTATLTSESMYVWGETRELVLTIPQDPGIIYFRFVSGSTPTTLSITGAVMPDDFVVEANRVYDVSVLDGYASVVSWAAS